MVHFMTSLGVSYGKHSPHNGLIIPFFLQLNLHFSTCSVTLKEHHYFVPLFNVSYLEMLSGSGRVGLN